MKNIMKKLLILILIIVGLPCSYYIMDVTSTYIKNSHFTLFQLRDGTILKNRIEAILKALKNKDAEALKGMLSEYVLTNAENIDENIEEFIAYYQGKRISYTEKLGTSGKTNHFGNISDRYVSGYCYVKTDADEYIIIFDEQVICEENPETVGLNFIQIARLSEYELDGRRRDDFRWTGYPGIYVTE
ncbi:hypothetical protein FACS189490_00890 [Clostridia bacterium]|nr:hypothetical protein FACS189490_00890 [Clostridia bacterium]